VTWEQYLLNLAVTVSMKSEDPRTAVGAVIYNPSDYSIVSTGYNGFPRGVTAVKTERFTKSNKHLFFEHAERNAIYTAARYGHRLDDCYMFGLWFPCPDCARAIVQVGIKKFGFSNWWLEKAFGATTPLLTLGMDTNSVAETCINSVAGDILREGGVELIVSNVEPVPLVGRCDTKEF